MFKRISDKYFDGAPLWQGLLFGLIVGAQIFALLWKL